MREYNNKFFRKIGYRSSTTESLLFQMKKDKRNKLWKRQRHKYGGWDERCSWDLRSFMTEQIYTWLKIYYKYASKRIDLDYHKFDIDGKEISEGNAILRAIADLEYFLVNGDSTNTPEEEAEAFKKVAEAYRIIGSILPTLWW